MWKLSYFLIDVSGGAAGRLSQQTGHHFNSSYPPFLSFSFFLHLFSSWNQLRSLGQCFIASMGRIFSWPKRRRLLKLEGRTLLIAVIIELLYKNIRCLFKYFQIIANRHNDTTSRHFYKRRKILVKNIANDPLAPSAVYIGPAMEALDWCFSFILFTHSLQNYTSCTIDVRFAIISIHGEKCFT